MRLDVFLKQSALVKRRPIAKALCDHDKIDRNGRTAKAADEVAAGDMLLIRLGSRTIEAEILAVPRGPVARGDRDLYFRVIREERHEDEDF